MSGIPAGAPQDAEYWHSRWEAALEIGEADAMHIIKLRGRALAAERERDAAVAALTRIRELHHPLECVNAFCPEEQWCAGCDPEGDCCCSTHRWPCPTVAALPPVDSPEDTNHG